MFQKVFLVESGCKKIYVRVAFDYYVPYLHICYFGAGESAILWGEVVTASYPKLMICVFKVGVSGFRVRISKEGVGLVQGLGDIAVVCTDILLLSSVFFDQQRQGDQACDFYISELLSCGSTYL